MKELCVEGLATHGGPESCGRPARARAEALTGVRAGRVLSREKLINSRVPTPSQCGRQHRPLATYRERRRDPARSENPSMRGTTMRENREIPWTPSGG